MTAEFARKHEDHAHEKAKRRSEERELDDALEDSFPASDPPAIVQPAKQEDSKPGKRKADNDKR